MTVVVVVILLVLTTIYANALVGELVGAWRKGRGHNFEGYLAVFFGLPAVGIAAVSRSRMAWIPAWPALLAACVVLVVIDYALCVVLARRSPHPR